MVSFTLRVILCFLVFSLAAVSAQLDSHMFYPANRPLAVRSPYWNTWQLSQSGAPPLSNNWPGYWNLTTSGVGWMGMIRIDNVTYSWLGRDEVNQTAANVTNVQITPTRTIYSMDVGPMKINVTFLSPIEPSDWIKQSLPFSYVSLEANSTDGNSHRVQVYHDFTDEWLSGYRNQSSAIATWQNGSTQASIYINSKLATTQSMMEINNQPQDGVVYHAMSLTPTITWQIDNGDVTRKEFVANGSLPNQIGQESAAIDNVYYAYAFADDLGMIQSMTSPVAWALGLARSPSIRYPDNAGGTQDLIPYFSTLFPGDLWNNPGKMIDAVVNDFSGAYNRSIALDERIMNDAGNFSSNYVDLVSLAARQTMAALDITTTQNESEDVFVFMKDIGVSSRVNPVERIYAAFPMYLYLNASLCGAMLRPLLDTQTNHPSGQPYAAQDLGSGYPIATANTVPHQQGIEQTGNMLTMLYAHARFSGDGSLLTQYYPLIKGWGSYLADNSLTFSGQESADGEGLSNMTNLAIKGIIGIKAAAEIARVLEMTDDSELFDSRASNLMSSWQSLAKPSSLSHLIAAYGDQQSWALMYNIYADRLLGTNLVPQSTLDSQTSYYSNLLATNPHTFGLPIDSLIGTTASAAWTMFTAATTTNDTVRDQLISSVWSRASNNQTGGDFVNMYNVDNGAVIAGNASPAMGAMYALLASNLQNVSISANGRAQGTVPSREGRSLVAPIVGGVVGTVVVVGIAIAVCWGLRKRRMLRASTRHGKPDMVPNPPLLDYDAEHDRTTDDVISTTQATVFSTFAEPYSTAPTPPWNGLENSKSHERTLNNPYLPGSSLVPSSYRTPSEYTDGHGQFSPPRTGRAAGTDDMTEAGTSVISPSDVSGLRAEVQDLRRVMQAIRSERLEPPPDYSSEYQGGV